MIESNTTRSVGKTIAIMSIAVSVCYVFPLSLAFPQSPQSKEILQNLTGRDLLFDRIALAIYLLRPIMFLLLALYSLILKGTKSVIIYAILTVMSIGFFGFFVKVTAIYAQEPDGMFAGIVVGINLIPFVFHMMFSVVILISVIRWYLLQKNEH